MSAIITIDRYAAHSLHLVGAAHGRPQAWAVGVVGRTASTGGPLVVEDAIVRACAIAEQQLCSAYK